MHLVRVDNQAIQTRERENHFKHYFYFERERICSRMFQKDTERNDRNNVNDL